MEPVVNIRVTAVQVAQPEAWHPERLTEAGQDYDIVEGSLLEETDHGRLAAEGKERFIYQEHRLRRPRRQIIYRLRRHGVT